MYRFTLEMILVPLVMVACKSSDSSTPKKVDDTLTGVWSGLEGPNPNRLTPTARLELTEDGGTVTGVLYSSNVFPDGGTWPVGSYTGTRDGGGVFLRDVPIPLTDGGFAEGSGPQG